MLKKLFGMYKQEFAPLTDEDIAFVEGLGTLPDTEDNLKTHQHALEGSRNACYGVSLAYYRSEPARAYLWATIALLAGHRDAVGWMQTLDGIVPRDHRFIIETIARKWHTLHKEDFARQKMAWVQKVKQAREEMGISLDIEMW